MVDDQDMTVARGIALHKMIRLITASTINGGYLNFMGNEFGHPEWIDFPRYGNDWSYKYARRQWSLVDRGELKYQYLNNFDRDMVKLVKGVKGFERSEIVPVWDNRGDQILAFARDKYLFIFNFNPVKSFTDYGFLVKNGTYKIVLNTDSKCFGGDQLVDESYKYMTMPDALYDADNKGWLKLYQIGRAHV